MANGQIPRFKALSKIHEELAGQFKHLWREWMVWRCAKKLLHEFAIITQKEYGMVWPKLLQQLRMQNQKELSPLTPSESQEGEEGESGDDNGTQTSSKKGGGKKVAIAKPEV